MLSDEPPIIAVFDTIDEDEKLRVSVLRFDTQAATFESVRRPIFMPYNGTNVKCRLIDRGFCIFDLGMPTYFLFYEHDECWRLVERHRFWWPSSNIQRPAHKIMHVSCSRFWFYKWMQVGRSLASLKCIEYIERSEPQFRECSLEPLPKKLLELEARTKSETKAEEVNWRSERIARLHTSFLGLHIYNRARQASTEFPLCANCEQQSEARYGRRRSACDSQCARDSRSASAALAGRRHAASASIFDACRHRLRFCRTTVRFLCHTRRADDNAKCGT